MPAHDHRLHHRGHGVIHRVLPGQAACLHALQPAHRLPGGLRCHPGGRVDRGENARGGQPGRRVPQLCPDRNEGHRRGGRPGHRGVRRIAIKKC